jgi:hypothetical protein
MARGVWRCAVSGQLALVVSDLKERGWVECNSAESLNVQISFNGMNMRFLMPPRLKKSFAHVFVRHDDVQLAAIFGAMSLP